MIMTTNEFVEFFINKNKTLIKNLSRRYLIPNRYNFDDIIQHISSTILTIMTNRQNSDNPIKDPEKYFSGCLSYYMIEYQRQHGFIMCFPKRPRKDYIEEEKEAKSKKFQYLTEAHDGDKSLLHDGYIHRQYNHEPSKTWSSLTGILHPKDAQVIDCLFAKNMTLIETSRYLDVAQSTCLNRRDRALRTLYDHFDNMTGEIKANVRNFIKSFQKPNDYDE